LTMLRVSRWLAIAGLCVVLDSCGGSPTQPQPPPGLSMTCPVNRSVQSPDGNPAPVTFDAPQTIGGSGGVTTTCTPQSGSQFPVGTSTVACQARDTANNQTSCSFTVVVTSPPRLVAAGKFLAFGDSLTAGVLSESATLLITSTPQSYPSQLQPRLIARYRLQTPVVINEGEPGELASTAGVQRFRGVLIGHRPDVVLLMEGTNDLLLGQTGANNAIDALRAMVREAKSQNIRIALATIPPQRAGGARRRDAVVALIPGFNDRIRALAATEGIPLVDVFSGMQADSSLIGPDDLHMTTRGYDVMAGIYFDAIKANFEVQPAATALQWTHR
jgi:lysophospholipase L1-like esterase